jgi:hypothetical protein
MSDYPSRGPFIFVCVLLGTMEILAFWIPRSSAFALGVVTARIIDYKWFDTSEETFTAWLLKTAIFVVGSVAALMGLQCIKSWYISGN